jgi:hypothetical protein
MELRVVNNNRAADYLMLAWAYKIAQLEISNTMPAIRNQIKNQEVVFDNQRDLRDLAHLPNHHPIHPHPLPATRQQGQPMKPPQVESALPLRAKRS